jgi:hypothetical protein
MAGEAAKGPKERNRKLLVEVPPMLRYNLFKRLCLLGRSNLLSPDEHNQLLEHVEQCQCCRAAYEEFSLTLGELQTGEPDDWNGALPSQIEEAGLRERFFKRAGAEGIRFSEGVQNRHSVTRREFPRLIPAWRWVALGTVLVVVVGMAGYRATHRGKGRSLEAVSQVQQKTAVNSQGHNTKDGLEAKLSELQAITEASQKTILSLKGENALMLMRIGALQEKLTTGQAEKQGLQQTLAHLSDMNSQLASRSDQNAGLLARTRAELEEIRADRTAMEAKIAEEKAEVGTLSQRLELQTASLDRERELLAAGRDITNLMGARNLHIIDVHDADGWGKNKKSFGRIFYTEGSSLIFYAFDLDEKKLAHAKYSFVAWGERLGEPASVRSLGIFYTDDKEQKRWILKVDSPQELAEIDSVFVTLEPHNGDNKPQGQKILYAFLRGKANHP